MPFKIAHLPVVDKLCQQIEVASLEQVYPRQVVADLLTEHDGWEQRGRTAIEKYVSNLMPSYGRQGFFLHLLHSTFMSKVVTHNQRKPSKGALVTPLFACEDDGTSGLGEV